MYWEKLKHILIHPWFLWPLFFINFFGSIYGFYWYDNQLLSTAWYWWLFVPDSPLASTFFTCVLFLYLVHRRSPIIEALATLTLFKYGIWAVVVIFWGDVLNPAPLLDSLTWQHWMLIVSHLGMAMQALLYLPIFTFKWKEIIFASTWILLNDLLDYTFDIHPWVVPQLEDLHFQLAIFTVSMSLFSIGVISFFSYQRISNTSG